MLQRNAMVLVLALGTLLLTVGVRAAAQSEVPRITIHELKGMIDQGASVLILDTLVNRDRPLYNHHNHEIAAGRLNTDHSTPFYSLSFKRPRH
jgi:hypothetical protein